MKCGLACVHYTNNSAAQALEQFALGVGSLPDRRCVTFTVLYFDHNATSPLCEAAREAWLEATTRFVGNPSSPHRLGSRSDRALQDAREQLAQFLGCKAHEIIWTAGATEGNNTIIRHAKHDGGEVWVSAIEHPCAQEPARYYFQDRLRSIPVRADGVIDIDWLREGLRHSLPALVAVMAANNETGVLQPWNAIQALCREAGVPFLCDAAQWLGKLPAAGLGSCDYVTGCAHKFGGPQGVGFIKTSGTLRAHLLGGPQEEGQRAGTENVAGVLAMIAALEAREKALAAGEAVKRAKIRAQFEAELVRQLPGTVIIGGGAERLWNTVAAIMPEIDCRQRWVVKLDKLGAAVSTGSACASGKERPSHVLSAMGIQPEKAARALRFSSGWETTQDDWHKLLELLERAMAELR